MRIRKKKQRAFRTSSTHFWAALTNSRLRGYFSHQSAHGTFSTVKHVGTVLKWRQTTYYVRCMDKPFPRMKVLPDVTRPLHQHSSSVLGVAQIGMRVRAPIFWDATSVRSLCYSVRVWASRGEANGTQWYAFSSTASTNNILLGLSRVGCSGW